MESLFSGQARSGADALLIQLTAEGANPIEALGRLAAHHAGASSGVRPLRSTGVKAGDQNFPAPQHVQPLLAQLLVRVAELFTQARTPRDDFYVGGFLLWGLTAIHPFDDGNGRTALDVVQQTLMRRWRADAPLFSRKTRLDHELQQVFVAIDTAAGATNDGSAEGYIAQLAGIARLLGGATLETLRADPHFSVLAQALAVSLQA